MPHRNVVRHFVPGGLYHCYNRGVEKRRIFLDEQDYGVFLDRLKQALADPDTFDDKERIDAIKSFYGDVELLACCLMPNHFHLLLYQHSERGVSEFMRTLSTSYTMYFNNRYKRVGPLFQGTYKARHADTEPYWQHISRYIHLNAISQGGDVVDYPYSSLRFYKRQNERPSWLLPERILEGYATYEKYESFIRDYGDLEDLSEIAKKYSLD